MSLIEFFGLPSPDASDSTGVRGVVNTVQGHIDDLRDLIQCGICIRPLYEPYTLACGHTFCYTCLCTWFSSGRSKKTCPDCRTPVKAQPAPAYLVRAVVQMFTSRAELLEKGETTAEHSKKQKEEAERLDKDRANDSGRGGGLFGGLFEPKRMHPLRPLVDADDGVTRCPVCAWELDADDTCDGCGWRYRPQDGSESEESDSSIGDDTPGYAWDESEFDEFGDLDDSYDSFWTGHDDGMRTSPESRVPPHLPVHDNEFAAIRGVLPASWVPLPHVHSEVPPVHFEETDGSEYDEEEDDDYDEMDSFIDDDENANHGFEETESDRDTVVGSAPARHRPLASRGPSGFVESSEDSEEKDEEEEDVEGYGTENIPVLHWSSSPTRPVSSSIPEDEADDPDRVQAERGRGYSSSLSSSEDSSEDESQSSRPPQRPARTPWAMGSSARNAIPVDGSEDEQPVGPVRRGTQRRRARFSPYPS